MTALYWMLLVAGGGIVLVQAALAAIGIGDGAGHDVQDLHEPHDAHDVHDALHLLSLRTLSAGAAAAGLAGLGAERAGWPVLVGLLGALVAAVAGAVAVAAAMRSMLRLQSDRSLRLAGAIGLVGQVYVPMPADGATPGKVMLTLQGRTVELPAVASDGAMLTAGTSVVVVDRREDGVFEVVTAPVL